MKQTRVWLAVLAAAVLTAACQPRVEVVAPREPITINLNLTIDADIRVRVAEQAEQDIENNAALF